MTDRARGAGKVAQTIERNASELLRAKPAPAQVAILFNRLSYMVGGEEPSLSKLGYAPRDSMMGLHEAFFEQQIPVDIVHTDDVIQKKMGQYKILFLPYPVMLSKDVAEGVARYVRNGGTAVAEARLAWNDERGFAGDVVPGFGLSEVFGAREKIIRPVEKARILVEANAALPSLKPHEAVFGEAFEEDLEPLAQARVLARFANGEPAIVEKSFGKGKAILIGSFLALAYERHPEDSTKRLLLAFARSAGASSEVEVSGPATSQVEVRRLVSERAQILFAFNHSKTLANPTFSVRLPWPVAEARNLMSDQVVPVSEAAGKTTLEKTVAGGEIWLVQLQRGRR